MNGDVHVRFRIRGFDGNISPTVTLSHPGAAYGSKGLAVRVRCVSVRIYIYVKMAEIIIYND